MNVNTICNPLLPSLFGDIKVPISYYMIGADLNRHLTSFNFQKKLRFTHIDGLVVYAGRVSRCIHNNT